MLEKIHEALWIAEGKMVSFYDFPYPTRPVVARLESGDPWVWSPVPALHAELDRLGRVRHRVGPNELHQLCLQDWRKAYSQAQVWEPQSTIGKRSDLKGREPLGGLTPLEWWSDIDQAWFRGRLGP